MPYDGGMKQKLTDKGVKNLKPNPAKRFDVRDTVLQGFILRVSPSGSKTFCLLKRINRVVRRQTLGHYPIMSLAEARERCRQLLYEIETGNFEVQTGVGIIKKPSFGEVIPDYIEKHAKARNKDWKRKAALLRKFSPLHTKRIDKITRGDVVKACDDIAASSACAGSPPRLENPAATFLTAARFQVPICVGCTLYFFDNSVIVISSRIASSATLALKSGEWFFRFVISDHLSHKLIHLNCWSEFPRPPLPSCLPQMNGGY